MPPGGLVTLLEVSECLLVLFLKADGFENLCYGTNATMLLINLRGKFGLLGVKSLPVIPCESKQQMKHGIKEAYR